MGEIDLRVVSVKVPSMGETDLRVVSLKVPSMGGIC